MIELELGILVYPPEADGEPWRATFTENGQRRFRQPATEAILAEKLEKVRDRLFADAVNMERPGADLIAHYLSGVALVAGARQVPKALTCINLLLAELHLPAAEFTPARSRARRPGGQAPFSPPMPSTTKSGRGHSPTP